MHYILWLTLLLLPPHCQVHKPYIDSAIPEPIIDVIDTVRYEPPQINTMAHVEYMRFHIGTPSQDTINMWLASVGLPPNNPFCSAALSHSLDVGGVASPSVRSGLARNFVYKTPKAIQISAKDVFRGMATVPAGSIVVYQRGETIFGHNGFVTAEFTGEGSIYISANTSAPGSGGSESAGGGVYEKPFRINPYSYFRVTDFVLVSYD